MRLELVRTVFRKELRETLRDRRSLAVMFGIPLLLYPIVTLLIGNLTVTRQKAMTEQIYRLAVVHAQADPLLLDRLRARESGFLIVESSRPAEALARREIDALLQLPHDLANLAMGAAPVTLRIELDRSRTEASIIERKLKTILGAYEKSVIQQRLRQHQVSESVLEPIAIETTDISTDTQRMGKILGLALPMILMMTGMLGALFPAVNATTAEREAGTFEALLVTPVRKIELLLAKSAIVLLSSLVTAALNLVSMSLVLWRVMSVAGLQGGLQVNFSSLLLAFVAVIPALIFFAAMVMVVALLARSFREANSYATPVMFIPMLALLVSIGEPTTTTALLVTPVMNTAVVIRDVLSGQATVGAFLLAFVSSSVYAGLMLSAATRMFTSEQLVNPAWEPLSFRGLRAGGRREGRLPAIDEALALFAFVLLLLFYVSPSLVKWGLLAIVAGNELLLITAPTLLLAWLGRYRWRETFALRTAPILAYAGAALLGVGLSLSIDLLFILQSHFWPPDANQLRQQAELLLPSLLKHPLLTVVGVGLLAGVCEELIFRGTIQTALGRRLSLWPTLLISGLLFAGMHMDLHGLPLRLLISLFLGWLVWRGGSIFPAMLMHALYDSTKLAMAWYALRGKDHTEALSEAMKSSGGIPTDLIIRAILGLVLLAVGWFLCRRGFGTSDATASTSLPDTPGRTQGEEILH